MRWKNVLNTNLHTASFLLLFVLLRLANFHFHTWTRKAILTAILELHLQFASDEERCPKFEDATTTIDNVISIEQILHAIDLCRYYYRAALVF
jgi:hypothetical protein